MSHQTRSLSAGPAHADRVRRAVRTATAFVLGAAISLTVAPAALAKLTVKSLRLGSSSGAVDYLYTAGNTVTELGSVDLGRYYRFDISDPSGTVRWSSACRPAPGNGTATSSYTLRATDPDSNFVAWRFRLREFSSTSACTSASSPQGDASLYFDVASATSYTSSALSTAQSAFGAGKSAYVQVAGAGSVKSSFWNTAQNAGSWSTAWVLPSGASACADTTAADLAGSSAAGQFPSSTSVASPAQPNLQYPPASGSGADPWNLASSYTTGPCPALGSGNQGAWSLRLTRDSTHFVVLPVFTVLTTLPHTTLTGGPSKTTASTTASFTFTSTVANSTFRCSLDGATASPCTSPHTYSGLLSGSHTFTVAAVDPAGNVDTTPATASWTVDTTSPAVTLTSPSAGSYTNTATPTLSGTAATTAGASNVTVKLYTGAGAAGTPVQTLSAAVLSGGGWSVSAAALPQGTYTAQAQQTNAVNTTGYSPASTFTVDTTAPGLTLYSPANGIHTNDALPQISGSAGTGPGDLPTVTVTVTVSGSGSPVQATASVSASGSWSVYLPQALADSSYTVQAAQRDLAGNTGTASEGITVDSTPPQTFLDGAPVNLTSSTTATFSFHSTDALSQAGSSFQCQLDGGSWSTCSSPQSYYNLSSGVHTFSVQAVDGAGNVDTVGQTAAWTVNTSLPAVTLDTPVQASVTNNTQPILSGAAGTAPGDASKVNVLIYANTDTTGSPVQTLTANVTAGSWSVAPTTALPGGTYVAYAQQTGAAGTGTSNAHAFTVNTQPPTTTINVGPPGSAGTGAATFSFSSSEYGSSFQCQLDGGGWTTCTSPKSYSALGSGSHTFQVRAIDLAGNVGAGASQSWTINTNLPAVTLTSPANGAETSAHMPSIAGNGGSASGDASTVSVNIYSGATTSGSPLQTITAPVASGAWSIEPSAPLADGIYTAYAQQAGSAGTAYTQAVTFIVNTQPPTTTIISEPQGATASTGARFTFTSSEAGSSFQCQLDGGAWTACTSPQSYSALATGSHSFSVRATDPAGNVDPNPPLAAWTIDPTIPVTLIAPTDGTSTSNTAPTFSGTATAANGPISVEIDDASGNAVEVLSASAAATWSTTASPALPDGTYTVFASQLASDGVTIDYSSSSTFTVDTTPPAVSLTSTPSATVNNRTPSFGGAAGTADGDAGTVTVKLYSGSAASGSPVETLSANVSSGSWSASAASLADGTYTVRAEQTDAAGNTGYSRSSTFTLDTAAPTTSITSGPAASTTATTGSFSFTSSKTGSTFACRLDSGPWTACTSPQSYSSLSLGSHTFSVRATDSVGNADGTPPSQSWTINQPATGGTPPPPADPTPPSSPAPSGAPSSTPTPSTGTQPSTPTTPSGTVPVHALLRAAATQHLGRKGSAGLVVTGSASKPCTVVLTAQVTSQSHSKRGHRAAARAIVVLNVPAVRLSAGKPVNIKIALSARTRAALVRALAHGGRLTMTLSAVATAPGVPSGSASVTINLVA